MEKYKMRSGTVRNLNRCKIWNLETSGELRNEQQDCEVRTQEEVTTKECL